MATFSKIDGAEPSTVTFSLRSVTLDINGATQHQELVTLAGSESSLAVAQVRAAAPASTEFGLVVRVAEPSTGPFVISSIVGPVNMRSSAANALVSVYQSTAADLNVTVAGYVAPSTTVQVSSLAGAVITRSSAANSLHTVYQSTAADLAITAHGNTSSNSSVYLPVRLTNGTSFLSAGTDYADGSTASNIAGPVLTFDNGSNATMRAVSLTLGLPVNVVAGSAAGSTIVTVSTVIGVVRIAGNNAADGIVHVGDSTNAALRVNVVAGAAGGSTIMTISTGSVRVHQSSAADLNVTVAGYVAPSTTIQISSLAGAVITRSSKADMLVSVYQSTASELQVTARVQTSSGGDIGSTAPLAVFIADSTGQRHVASTHYNTSNCGQYAPLVRPIIPICNSTTVLITSTHSTAIYELISSVAGLRHKVFAYFVGSTHTNPSTMIFCSSASAAGFDHWSVNFGSGSSGITGANLCMAPPGFIFAGIAQNALNVKIEGGSSVTSTVVARIALSWFDEV